MNTKGYLLQEWPGVHIESSEHTNTKDSKSRCKIINHHNNFSPKSLFRIGSHAPSDGMKQQDYGQSEASDSTSRGVSRVESLLKSLHHQIFLVASIADWIVTIHRSGGWWAHDKENLYEINFCQTTSNLWAARDLLLSGLTFLHFVIIFPVCPSNYLPSEPILLFLTQQNTSLFHSSISTLNQPLTCPYICRPHFGVPSIHPLGATHCQSLTDHSFDPFVNCDLPVTQINTSLSCKWM
jgi:hypothetical protein